MKKIIVKKDGKVFRESILEDDQITAEIESLDKDLTHEIIDLDSDPEYLLKVCYEKRLAAYPSVGDQLDALYKARAGDSSEIEAIDAIIKKAKDDNPKPNKN